ncbi:MAG: 2-C-methyl-D-erythritol 2,4-cyclodiphosphate synthase [Ignavibacteria bacterium]|nr:2-C-methyl-D-erythritol 2,4-cyclodiphosphate synthase [Ignavibacteria bacterium]MBK7254315.1 2-C-methyl-D-erythritol 2,4-cyclodiphosphate synthase [Ignavibacteria bacterium]MBK7446481.1 2-C-methyl-D-erythritol 2,4-cyclodiphosphate synthase [Ignavibacteria bacterium]MBK9405040.1 2-C-methyl-D-erythritol 2,4-cyclodiphosphate synthase [Ignavibacteria bacterium]
MEKPNFKTGFGYDVHKFSSDRKLILGGVEIPYSFGLEGHSDADVLLHAVCDSILGAAGFSDIGNQFPNTDPDFKDISSLVLLKKSYELIKHEGWKIGNIDCVVILEEPKIYKYSDDMKKNISEILETDCISIKATTSEGIGFVGRKEGCVAYCTSLIYK